MTPAEVLIRNVRGHPRDAAALAAWSVVQALPALASGWAVAEAAGQFLANRTIDGLAWLGLLAAAALAGAAATRQTFLKLGALVEPLRDDLVELIVSGALAGSGGPDKGGAATSRWIARVTHQAEIVRDSWAGVLSVACTSVFTVGAAVIGLVTLLPATLPYVLPPLAVSVIALRLLLRPFATRQRESVVTEEAVADATARAVTGVRDVTACGGEDMVLAGLDELITRQAAATRSAARAGALRLLCVTAGGWLPLLLVLAAAPSMLRGGVSPAHIIGAVTYLSGSLRAMLNTLSTGMGGSVVRLTVALERILSEARTGTHRNARHGPAGRPALGRAGANGVRGHLQARHVTFGYGANAEPVIRDLSLDIPAGDHLAVVGPSGIGKSSLAGLLAGTLRPGDGNVFLDGAPVSAQGRQWRVLIPQEAYVFSGTLEANLTYYRPGSGGTVSGTVSDGTASLAELDAAAEAVGLTALVTRLGGYRAHVDPLALSAGERQLIALTRAYLSTACVVILDEAACHLDPAAEHVAEEAFARRGGTLIVIAHRITSALRARRVLVLDGTSAQAGDHIRLLGDSAMYRDLVGYWTQAG